ncbi:MAG: hypothetical protein ABIK28_25040 [Planctomycetota bacterium]
MLPPKPGFSFHPFLGYAPYMISGDVPSWIREAGWVSKRVGSLGLYINKPENMVVLPIRRRSAERSGESGEGSLFTLDNIALQAVGDLTSPFCLQSAVLVLSGDETLNLLPAGGCGLIPY